MGGTCRVASEQLKRKGQGSKAGPWKRPVLSVLPLRCGPRWGQPKGGRGRSFRRSPQADPALPSSPPRSGPSARVDAAGAPTPAGQALLSALPSTPLHSPPHLSALLTPLPFSPPALLTPFLPRIPPGAAPVPQFTCGSFPRGPWQPSNREPEAEGGQDPALSLRMLRALGCQAICVSHTDD